MLDLPQALPMFASQAIDAVDDVDAKFNATHLYYQTQHAVQIIQLVECAPPPPRRILSPEQSSYSSCLSSSYCSEEEEEESECSSYCSSIEPVLEQSCPPQPATSESADTDTDTYGLRMKRILAWREDFSSHLSSTLSDTSISTSSLKKRKMSISAEDIDSVSLVSSRSAPSTFPSPRPRPPHLPPPSPYSFLLGS
ncbi:hypothetical protein D9757_009027 [Collybiopsis confluens]|uniref:Uncharacterized protein n=1 Tax=Collybiopsis confluens TaxID=2823264 RepID=A0A8H5M5H8_9AGAR|nr:hypothetical protein D9757_009027 [Collybiopsis confluens]